jgi:hypothetical protein
MSITIKDYFTEICKRNCVIETTNKFSTDHLPKCLATVHKFNIIENHTGKKADFIVRERNMSSYCIYFIHNNNYARNLNIFDDYSVLISKYGINSGPYNISNTNNFSKDIEQLDILTNFLHTKDNSSLSYNDYTNSFIYTGKQIISQITLNKIMLTKMINSLIKNHILIHICALYNIFEIAELRFLIINNIFKLSNWHNLGFSMKFSMQ